MLLQTPDNTPEELVQQARALIIKCQNPSVAFLQRHLTIGYSHAQGLMHQFEGEIVTAPDANGWRQMLSSGTRSPDDPLFTSEIYDIDE